ncbi:MAG TPA: STAS domain-containing protein [Jatrophihabitans sp.]|nr:STAS domain-containing protein [Jatrophihabitans sp.]
MSSLALSTRRESGRAVVSLAGELDLATVDSLREVALAELSDAECRTLVLDLDGLTFLDSTGLGCWVELRNRAGEQGKSLQLDAVPPAALRTMTIAGLAPLFGVDAGPGPEEISAT